MGNPDSAEGRGGLSNGSGDDIDKSELLLNRHTDNMEKTDVKARVEEDSELLSLPMEIRLQIYEYVLILNCTSFVADSDARTRVHLETNAIWRSHRNRRHFRAITQTCHQIRKDMTSMPRSRSIFPAPDTPEEAFTPCMSDVLTATPLDEVTRILVIQNRCCAEKISEVDPYRPMPNRPPMWDSEEVSDFLDDLAQLEVVFVHHPKVLGTFWTVREQAGYVRELQRLCELRGIKVMYLSG